MYLFWKQVLCSVASWFVFFLGSEKGMLLMSLFLSQCDSSVFDANPFNFSVKCGTVVVCKPIPRVCYEDVEELYQKIET